MSSVPDRPSRRTFLKVALPAAAVAGFPCPRPARAADPAGDAAEDAPGPAAGGLSYKGEGIRFGLVTYQWGRDWDLATLLSNCAKAGVEGVELRTTHAHGVEPELDAAARAEVRAMFDGSPVTCVGPGSDERFDHPDPIVLRAAIERTKEFIRLSHDIGGSGVKVKPDRFHDGIPHDKTIGQIGLALRELGDYAVGFGQEVRLEVHGQCAELPTMLQIMQAADHPQAVVCWNSNPQDLKGDGIEANFALVENHLGLTAHVHELDSDAYPYQKLIDLLVNIDYPGWVLLEASSDPEDRGLALAGQRARFDTLLTSARQRATG